MTQTIYLFKGDTIKVLLPSGKEIHIEVTQDTIDVVTDDDQVLYTAELNEFDWVQVHPKV